MGWRLDWCLLATAFIGLGFVVAQRRRAELLPLLGDEGGGADELFLGASDWAIPAVLLTACAVRLVWRVTTGTWR